MLEASGDYRFFGAVVYKYGYSAEQTARQGQGAGQQKGIDIAPESAGKSPEKPNKRIEYYSPGLAGMDFRIAGGGKVFQIGLDFLFA
jgi:hypothetical protein